MKIRQKEMAYSGIIITALLVSYLCWTFAAKLFFYEELPEHWKPMPLPELQAPLTLRVVYVENPRFKSITESQIDKILIKTSELVSKHLFTQIEFQRSENITAHKLFHFLPFIAKRHQAKKIIHIQNEKNDIESFNETRILVTSAPLIFYDAIFIAS